MKMFFFFVLIFFLQSFELNAGFKIKGGVFSGGGKSNFETKNVKERSDLKFDLKNFDSSHLEVKLNKFDAIRFENRVGIGAPPSRVVRYIGKKRKEVINLIVNELENYKDEVEWPNWTVNKIPTNFIDQGLRQHKKNYCTPDLYRMSLEAAWSESILSSRTPQYDRLALFWLNHFSVAYDTYDQFHAFFEHLKIIRKNSNGNFVKFLEQSLYDPGVIIYLNNEKSTSKNPNENLAREFFELFSLGEGNYSENDIKNFSRFLSAYGINYVSEKFQYYNSKKSSGKFSAFGKEYKTLDQFLNILKNHPAFGEFIAKKFYNEYVELGSPSKKDLAFLVATFRNSDFKISSLLKATLSLEKFWSKENKLSLVKSPIDLMYGIARTLNYAGRWRDNHKGLIIMSKLLGQDLFNPPNIAGWPTGKEWISGQLLENRIKSIEGEFINILRDDRPANSFVNRKENKMLSSSKDNSSEYQKELKNFFENLPEGQLAVETIIINWVPKDFETKEYAQMRIGFYNVKFNGRHWDGMELSLGTDINQKKNKHWRMFNFISFQQGFSYPEAVTSWKKTWINDWNGHREFRSSYPSGPDMRRIVSLKKEEKLLVKRLLQAMDHVLQNANRQPQLYKNIYAQKWLRERVNEVKENKLKSSNGFYNTTKVFSFPSGYQIGGFFQKGDKVNVFNCSAKRFGFDPRKEFDSNVLNNYFDSSILKTGNIEFNISELFIPELNLKIDNENYLSVLTHEGYQLK